MISIQPVLMAGGSGTRLWPLSRATYPKQFLCLSGSQGDQRSLFQQAVSRLAAVAGDGVEARPLLIVGNEEHRFLMLDQLREIKAACGAILLEPAGRNTAPAVTLAALAALEDGADPVLVVTPADQTVTDPAAFTAALRRAVQAAAGGAIVVLGIEPDRAETGYGYIRAGRAGADGGTAPVEAFVEKPDAATAERYLAEGGYYWNAGLFVLRASTWLRALEAFRPDIAQATRAAWERRATDASFVRPGRAEFEAIAAESVDYAVMERCPGSGFDIRMVPLAAGWSDLGAWDAVWQVSDKDTAGNASVGDTMVHASRNTLVHATSRLVGVIGLDDVVVVETPDAVLVSRRGDSQQVKGIVQQLADSIALRAHAAPPGAPAVGLVRQHRQRPALPGQAHHGQARRDAVAAEAPPPRRALDRRLGHRRGDLRRQGIAADREPEHLHPARRGAPPRQPRQGAARDHRGAVGQLPGRGRHRALRGHLRAQLGAAHAPPPPPPATPFHADHPISATTAVFEAAADVSVLDAARQAGLVLEHSCRTGRCGTCRARADRRHGRADQARPGAVSVAERAAGWVLTCTSAPPPPTSRSTSRTSACRPTSSARTLPCRIDSIERPAPDVADRAAAPAAERRALR